MVRVGSRRPGWCAGARSGWSRSGCRRGGPGPASPGRGSSTGDGRCSGLAGGKGVPSGRQPSGRVRHPHRALLRARPHPIRSTAGRGRSRPCRMRRDITRLPARPPARLHHPAHRGPPARSAGRSAWTATTTPHHVVWNAWAGELWRRTIITLDPRAASRSSAPTASSCGSPTARSPNTSAAASSTSTPCIRLDQRRPRRPGCDTAATGRDHRRRARASSSPPPSPSTAVPDPGLPRHRATPGPSSGARSSTSAPSPLSASADGAPDVSAPRPSPPTWPSTPPRPPNPPGCRSPARMTGETAEHYADPDTHLGRLIAYAWQLGTLPVRLDERAAARATGTTPTAGSAAGPTCSASAATSPPSPAATPPPTSSCAPPAANGSAPPAPTGANRHHDRRRRLWSTTDDDTTLIVCDLHLAGIGWNTTADAQLAAAAAARAREHRALLREERTTA